ncbi:hypothetical protein M9H77_12614 [Catharanthus roseus]|uniref:Uncharacterized protein n=1 Tax=Catharanthus roseus TaxID=4058 RepID=A0ACC0BHX3_CATRO|nr:hypothetical protein M9H77_12614 [Catharanthus roseus]
MLNHSRKAKTEHRNEAQLPNHYNEGAHGSSHSNLDPMKVIMQELQHMRKDMKEMRENITNFSMKHNSKATLEVMSLLILNGDMVTSLLTLELLSIILMIAMRAIDLEIEMFTMINLMREFQGMKLEMEGIMRIWREGSIKEEMIMSNLS